MDRNSLHTSVVIEVANQEEPDDQKTYHIDFDDLDVPKDYVIDRVFCGESITVYALFEVPQDSSVSSNDQMVEVTSQKADNCRFFHRNSSKQIMTHRKLNGFKRSLMNQEESVGDVQPDKDNENRSFYCLKHLRGDYDMLTPERENSELKVLYSKNSSPGDSKSTKFKAVSKGVNTDIVQSPKVINEVQKAVKQNLPASKSTEVKSISSSIPSYEVIEMEMRQSFSSVSSYGDSRKPSKKSAPNFFLVPLLMMDDGVLGHFQKEEKIQKLLDEKEKKAIVPEKVSLGINTDILMSTFPFNGNKQNENGLDVSPLDRLESESDVRSKELNFNSHGKLKSKNTILSEIKKLKGKLDALIKSMELNAFDLDPIDVGSIVVEDPPQEKLDSFQETLSEFKPLKMTSRVYDDLPIFSLPVNPQSKTGKKKPAGSQSKGQGTVVVPTTSNSVEFISGESTSKSQITRTNSIPNCRYIKSKEGLKEFPSNCSIVWTELENREGSRKGAGLSKSTNTGLNSLDSKFSVINGLKKSFSFDLRDVKVEVMCLKKIKNNSFKLETKANMRIPQKMETIIKCEMGDEACNKLKTSKIDLLSLSIPMEKAEDLKFEQKNLDSKKILKEEGDVKLVYSTQNLLAQIIARKTENVEVHFCDSINITAQDNLLPVVENMLPTLVKAKGAGSVVEPEPKAVSEADKPPTPSKTCKRPIFPNVNTKKEVKTLKKLKYQPNKVKQVDKTTKIEAKESGSLQSKQRSVTGSRKFPVKGTAESKLHVDKLMRTDTLILTKTAVEKPAVKTSRSACQKRDPAEESKQKTSKTNSALNKKENSLTRGLERIGEDSSEDTCQEVVPEQSVVLELLSEKPSEMQCLDVNKKYTELIKSLDGDVTYELKAKTQEETFEESLNPEKPVATSVWALTKVLLFEDGSKKIEILEASLTPPGYSLAKTPTE